MSETEKVMRKITAIFEGEYDWDNHQRTNCPYLTGTKLAGFYMQGFKAARCGQPHYFGREISAEGDGDTE